MLGGVIVYIEGNKNTRRTLCHMSGEALTCRLATVNEGTSG